MEVIVRRAAAARADTIRTFLEDTFVRVCSWRTARVLQDLDDRLLDDIGVHRQAIQAVSQRHGRRLWQSWRSPFYS
jgi:uncharacterized protein YjiS (DUF1127 family)